MKLKLLPLLLLISCAQPKLYLNEKEAIPFKEFSKKTPIESSKSFKINAVTDSRKNKASVGMGRTGVSYKETPLELVVPFEDYIKSYLTRSLTERGVLVDELGEVEIDFVINDLWVDELIEKYQPEKARCSANMTVYSKVGNTNWSANYWTEIISPGDLSDGTEKLAPTLASCLNEIVEKMAKDQSFRVIVK